MQVRKYGTYPGNLLECVKDVLREKTLVATDRVYLPQSKGRGTVLEGDVREMAGRLVQILREKNSVVR